MKFERAVGWPVEFDRLYGTRNRVMTAVFGDRLGVIIFLGALVFFGLYWRISFFITDNWTLGNALYALANGQLHLDSTIYGPPQVRTPGYYIFDGRIYGRNYGQLFLALPVLFVLEAASVIADLRIAIAAVWSLLLLGFVRRVGLFVGEKENFALLGGAAALLFFGVNIAFATPLESRLHYLLALQITNVLLAALIGVVLYRLVSDIHDQRTGIFVGAGTVLATPVAFWASIPKRHVLVAFLAVLTLYSFYRSRTAESTATALLNRSVAYASVGFWAWVHAPEALTMLVVLVPLDLATARSNSWRRLTVIGTVFLTSLLPFFLTNWLISGSPMRPPRFLPKSGSSEVNAGVGGAGSGGSGGAAAGGTPSGGGPSAMNEFISGVSAELSPVLSPLTVLSDLFVSGLQVLVDQPFRVAHTFIWSSPATTRATATDLTLLETTPIFGVFIAIPLLLFLRTRVANGRMTSSSSPVRQTDGFALAFVVLFTMLYLSRLPLNAMWTVRYLLPIVPFGMYFVGRLWPVRRVLMDHGRLLIYSYAGLVLISGQLLVVYLFSLDTTLGEVIQLHGGLGLAAAAIVGAWLVAALSGVSEETRFGAVALAVPLAVGTIFVLLAGIAYFVPENHALAMVRLVSQAISLF